MTKQFAGKVALVTGGTLGIGLASAITLAEAGASVMLGGRNPEAGQRAVEQIQSAGGTASYVKLDVTDVTMVQTAIQEVVKQYGHLDYLVNSAGTEGEVNNTVDCSLDNWHKVINTNLTGTWYCMKHALPEMLKNGGGAIVNIASVIGVVGFPNLPAYTASKSGVIGLTKTAALEYAEQNVRVNVVCPGSIRTPMYDRFSGGSADVEAYMATFHPIGRIGEAPEVASAVSWLCSDGASFVTGHVLPVAGGWEVR